MLFLKRNPELIWYDGQLWFWFGMRSHGDRLCLVCIKDRHKGTQAKETKCRTLSDEEYDKQLNAIRYFLKKERENEQKDNVQDITKKT